MKFLRRAAYFASMMTLFQMLSCALLAQVDPSVLRQQEEARQRQREADNIAAIASILSAIEHRQALEDLRRADDEPSNYAEKFWRGFWTQTTANFTLAVLAAIAGFIGLKTLRAIEREVEATGKTAKAAEDAVIEAQRSRGIARNAAISAKFNARAAQKALRTNREIERAYIGITKTKVFAHHAQDSHGGQDPNHPISITVNLTIENFGRTPGDLLGGYWGWNIGAEPKVSDISRGGHLSPAFLKQGDSVPFEFTLKEDEATLLTVLKADRGPVSLWLVAEIHYEDRFGGLHAGGYGRRLASGNRYGNQLAFQFTPETGPFNYDRKMHPDNQRNYGKSQKPKSGNS